MRRKIIRQGHNTMTLTLPSEWIKRFNLQAGSEVDVLEKDNGLFITTEKNSSHKKAELNIDGLDIPTIWKYFMAVYREGYDEIIVKFSPELKLPSPYMFFSKRKLDLKFKKESERKTGVDFLSQLVSRFIGLEIIDYGKDYVTIKDMTEPTSKEFDNSLRRIFLLIQQMVDEIVEALKSENTMSLEHIHSVDINIDKFHDYCVRILNKMGNKESRKTSLLYSSLFLLEMMGDEFKAISQHLIQDYSKMSFKGIEQFMDSIKTGIYLYYDLFYKFNKETVVKMSELDKERYFGLEKNKIEKAEEQEIFHHLRLIAKYLNALLELRIEMEF